MRCGCILLVFAIGLIVLGIAGMREAQAFQKPVTMPCEAFLKSPSQEGWFHLTGCEIDVTEGAYSARKSKYQVSADKDADITALYIPIRDRKNEQDDKQSPAPLVWKTTDADIMETAKEARNLDDSKSEDDVKKWLVQNANRLFFRRDVSGMVLAGISSDSSTRGEIAKLDNSLTPNYVIIEEGKTPSMSGAIGMIVGGIVLGIVSLFYWMSRLGRRSQGNVGQ